MGFLLQVKKHNVVISNAIRVICRKNNFIIGNKDSENLVKNKKNSKKMSSH